MFHSARRYRSTLTAPEVFADLPQLETERLILRKLTMRDAQDVYEYCRDAQVAEHVLWSPHKSLFDTRGYLRFILRQYRDGVPSSYGMVLKETGRVIGTIGFMNYSPENSSAEVGYSMGRPYWNKGLMTEALQALIAMAFEDLHVHRVEAMHETTNPASGKVMLKCGMQYEGVMRGKIFNKGHYSDVAMYAILHDDWMNLRK